MNMRWFLVLLLWAAGTAFAEDEDPELAALSLGSSESASAEQSRSWKLLLEGAAGRSNLAGESRAEQRFSADIHVEAKLASDLSAVFSDRVDIGWQRGFDQRDDVNTLKEVYVSWRPRQDVIVDLGRVNQYTGVAFGYNPTDFLRDGAVRSLVSLDPASIRENRQGSVMLRGQALWDSGSLTALYSPTLRSHSSDAAYDPDWGATNSRNRGLLIFSQKIADDLNPQWLLYMDQDASPQFGVNLTKLINDSTVAYVEWSGGQSASLFAQALDGPQDETFRNRLTTGFTYTTASKLSLTLEYQYNGAGLERDQWERLPAFSLPAYVKYRQFVQVLQDLPTRHAAFFYASWQDVGIKNLNMASMLRYNMDDYSRLSWLEIRYRWPHDEIAWQWQRTSGSALSDYGAMPVNNAWQFVLRHYF